MATKAKKTKGMTAGQKMSIGVALSAAAASALGAYFLAGTKDAAKNRKLVKSWMLKAKAEVLEAIETAKQMDSDDFEKIVASIGTAYANAGKVSKKELGEFKGEMLQHWKKLEKTLEKEKKAKASAKKAAKKTAAM